MIGSTFDELKHRDLPNWGRFSRSYLPPLAEARNTRIYGLIKDDDEGHGSILELLQMVQAGKVPLSAVAQFKPGASGDESPIRKDDALELDGYMQRMMTRAKECRRTMRNFRILKSQFYRQEKTKRGRYRVVRPDDLDTAIRALMDLIFGENRYVS